MKRFVYSLFVILLVSCTESYDPFNYDPFGGFGGNQGGGQNVNQNVNPPEETFPVGTDVTVEEEADSEDNVNNNKFDGTISVVFSDSEATVDGSVKNVTVEINGTRVTVNNTGDKKVKYVLSGACTDGYFKLYSSKKQAIVLSNLSLSNSKGAAINNQGKKRTYVVLEGSNAVSDGNVNSSGDYPEETSDEDMKAAIFSEGQLLFSGTGTLTVNAKGKAGITSDDYVRFLTGSNVTVNSKKGHGVRGKDAIIVSGGIVNITLESSATGKKCFSTDSLMYISGGNIALVNNASAGLIDSELTGAAGIKADKQFIIRGGELSIMASGKGCKCISGDEAGFFEGGKVIAKASGANYGTTGRRNTDSDTSVSSKAIKFDGNLEFSGSEITASSAAHEAIESKGTIFISDGSICAIAYDDAINSASTMTITGGVVYAFSTGNDGLDANGNLIIRGGNVYAVGCGSPEVGIDANTESGYKFYLLGGNLIAISGIESGSYISQPVISTSWSRNVTYSLCNGDNVFFSFKAPSSGGSGLYMSSPSLVSGSGYSLRSSSAVSGQESFFDGILSLGGIASGGSSSSVTAYDYVSYGGNQGFGPGGQGGPGGRGW